MQLADLLQNVFRRSRTRIADRSGLADFLSSRAAFLSQKCVTEFCRVRAGVYWEKLFREAQFQDALLRSCWMAHAPALAMLTEMVEGVLRRIAPSSAETDIREALVSVATEVRNGLILPAQVDREAWDGQAGLVADQLARAALAAPRPVRELADPLARQVFEALPIHPRLLTNDFDYIFNNLRMNILRAHDDFIGVADPAAIIDDLTTARPET
jgi:hypothetical protein